MRSLVVILSLFSTIASANSESDKNKLINSLTQRYAEFFCSSELLACLNKSKSECIDSVVTATSKCPIDSFYKATIPVNKDEELQLKEIEKEGYLFGNCIYDTFVKNIGTRESTLKDCEMSLPALEAAK